jgi:hypothetical protein
MTRQAVVSLFDESGNALKPWFECGWTCYAIDIVNTGKIERHPSGGSITYLHRDLRSVLCQQEVKALRPKFIMGFPPCTDLAVSGAAWFEAKRAVNPDFQFEATDLARVVEKIGNDCGVGWFAENPVSVLSTLWRKPDYRFHPYEYGGYLPIDDVHPRWPDYIAARDTYPKKTCLWTGGNFIMPRKRPVPLRDWKFDDPVQKYSTQHLKLGGKSAKTKQIRSEGPRGFLKAVFEANRPDPILGLDI